MIAYYSITAFTTLYIKEIIQDSGDDYVIFFVSDNTGNKTRTLKSIVRFTTKGSPYFMHNHKRIYLDECLKINH